MRITDLPSKWVYPRKYKAQISTKHMDIIAYSQSIYDGTSATKRKILKALNIVSYMVCNSESFPEDWSPENPIDTLPDISIKTLKSYLQELYIDTLDVQWDMDIVELDEDVESEKEIPEDVEDENPSEPYDADAGYQKFEEANPEDLYLTGPRVPRFDPEQKYVSKIIEGTEFAIYRSLPDIPTRQCEISVTTDPRILSDMDYLRLYPNIIFYTRPPEMYYRLENVEYDQILGSILKVSGFTKKQLRDNIIKYPHLENIMRIGYSKGERLLVEFGRYIEIDGKLHRTKDIWSELSDTKHLPKSKVLMQEYVVRRYLLERDIKGVDHKYKMFGELDPFLTLFMPRNSYINMGYKDTLDIAKQCVNSRISYLKSRNPVLRRIAEDE